MGDALETPNSIVDEALTFSLLEVREARAIIESVRSISARDATHVAVMRRAEIGRIVSFDRGFDNCPGIARLD